MKNEPNPDYKPVPYQTSGWGDWSLFIQQLRHAIHIMHPEAHLVVKIEALGKHGYPWRWSLCQWERTHCTCCPSP